VDNCFLVKSTGEAENFFLLKLDRAVFDGINSVIDSEANILAGMVFLATLAQNDLAGGYFLTTEDFNAEALGLTVFEIFRGSARFDMCHDNSMKLYNSNG